MIEDNKKLEDKELALSNRLERIKALEAEIIEREKALKNKENAKKQILLRLSPTLWQDISEWAEADFRSVNGQIEFLLAEAVRSRKRNK